MIGTVWNSHFAASTAAFGNFIQNYAQQSVALRGIMRNWDEARIDAFMRLDVNDVRDFYFADLANRANAWGKLFDNGAETIENALITRYIAETNRNGQVVGYVSGTALGRKTFKAINRLTLLAPPSTKPVVFVENMQDLLLSGKLSAEIDNGVVVIKARPDNGAWDEVARLSPDMSDATPVSNFQPADIRQTIYDPATGYSMALVCSGPRCSWVEGACFPAGTPVHTPAGLVPIEKISIGDTVLAYNESSKTPTLASVTNVFHKTWRGLLRIIAGRDTLLATPNHPFYLPGSGRYMPADSLRQGMQLLALTGALLTVQSVAAVDTTVSVYNFEVAEHHNYYVGEEGVLVHNDCVLVKAGLLRQNPNAENWAVEAISEFYGFNATEGINTPIVQIELNNLTRSLDIENKAGRTELFSFFNCTDLGALPLSQLRLKAQYRVKAWLTFPDVLIPMERKQRIGKVLAQFYELRTGGTNSSDLSFFINDDIIDGSISDIIIHGDTPVSPEGLLPNEICRFSKIEQEEILVISDDLFINPSQSDVAPSRIEGVSTQTTSSSTEIFNNIGILPHGYFQIRFVEDISIYQFSLEVKTAIQNRYLIRSNFPNIPDNFEAHHIIPVELLKTNAVVQRAVEAGFEFNGAINGIPLKKFTQLTPDGRHARHDYYTNQINDYLNDVWLPENPEYSSADALNKIIDLTHQLRYLIESSTEKINLLHLTLH